MDWTGIHHVYLMSLDILIVVINFNILLMLIWPKVMSRTSNRHVFDNSFNITGVFSYFWSPRKRLNNFVYLVVPLVVKLLDILSALWRFNVQHFYEVTRQTYLSGKACTCTPHRASWDTWNNSSRVNITLYI